ncbi:cytochrome P450 [Pseudarthrobacter sp. fls2-241-R2A-168]|uniref:cytochrome P450 n=1 Tax=Pseudarthrobacter sp. fls2-241-R2A-168 TaxID=3040304 RepID=UPI00255546A3|nr:cytochrome P450 [Pseudarthrobacter sp. fls2-241-R2A-168]
MAQQEAVNEFNPHYEETFDNSHVYYEEMRAKCPVAHSESFGGFWAVFKYEDIIRVQTEHETFSTAEKNVVPPATRNQGKRPPLHFDPPEHDTYRRPVTPVFAKSRMAVLEPELRRFADELIDPLIAAGHFDYTLDFAEYFAARAFGLILKLPLDMMLRSREVQVQYYRAQMAMDKLKVVEWSDRLYEVAKEIVFARKQNLLNPDEDLISALLLAGERGEAIPDDMVVASIRQFLSASQAAPGAVLGSIATHLARDQELQQRLRENPDRIPDAVEEFLRLYSPYRVFARTATHDVEIRDRQIPAGEPIAMIFPSANRDEDVFENPHEFNMDRKPNKHIAFGRGPHRCPAASLARLELCIGVEALLRKTKSFELAGDVKMTDWLEFGPSSTPLRAVPA